METDSFAPIVLFVYNRLAHTRATVEALQKNKEAAESELYIYSDGAKTESGREAIDEVRQYIRSIRGFKHLHIVEKENNQGLSESVITGVTEVLKQYDQVIVLEDDLITTSDFLEYMNQALAFYKDDLSIYSISGYTFPSPHLKEIKEDVFLYPRPASWGWASWKNRWEKSDWKMKDFKKFSENKSSIRSFLMGGEDMYMMLLKQQRGLIQSWAIRWAYTHFTHHAYSLYPTQSKVRSIGTDSSGTNLPSTKKYDTEIREGVLHFIPQLQPDYSLIFRLKDFYKPSLQRRFINWYKFGVYSWLKASK
ncbi:MAG: putative glycosyltransferase [Chitinophagaceae bacterium]|nr:putative glycosyltransferase [Chitinophagaceae bacterium]